jgi:hypothetical protein
MMFDSDKRVMVLAIGIGVGLMLISGWGYRHLARYLDRPAETMAMSAGTLAKLPMNLGSWEGTDLPLESGVVRALDAEDYLNRGYARYLGTEAVELFIVYGVRGRDLMPHRPEVCYPANGWVLREADRDQLPIAEAENLECKIYHFDRSGLDFNAISVLNYYIIDGQYCPDVSLLKSKAWRGSGALRYLVQVQISCPLGLTRTSETTNRILRDFAVDSAPAIRSLLADIESKSVSGSP